MMTKASKTWLKFRHPLNLSEGSDQVIREFGKFKPFQPISSNYTLLPVLVIFPQFNMEYPNFPCT